GLEIDRPADAAQDAGDASAAALDHLGHATFGAAHAGPRIDRDLVTVHRRTAVLRGHEHGAFLGGDEAVAGGVHRDAPDRALVGTLEACLRGALGDGAGALG